MALKVSDIGEKELINYILSKSKDIVADDTADVDEAKRLYGIEFVRMDKIKDIDVVVLAVAHENIKRITIDELDGMFRKGKKILIDVKGRLELVNKTDFEYWCL